MKWLLQFILSHSIFIALCAVALSLQTLVLLSTFTNPFILGFIFFATLAGYNAYWMVSRLSFNHHTTVGAFLFKCRSSVLVMLLAIVGLLYCATSVHLVMYNTIATAILLLLYAVPVLPFKKIHFTRKAGFLKTIVLAIAWTIVTVLIPLQQSIFEINRAALLIFCNRFLLMLMLCIIFDKRDAAVDKIRGLQSLATDVKPRLLHVLMGLILLAYGVFSCLLPAYGIQWVQVGALLLTGIITGAVYLASFKNRGYLFYYFLVDGLMFLSGMLTLIADRFSR